MVHRCKKCSDISEVTSGGRAEIENMKNYRLSDMQLHLHYQMLLLKYYHTFYIHGALGKKPFVGFWKDSLSAESQADFQIFAIFAS